MSVEYLGKVNNIVTVEKLKELTGMTVGTYSSGDITWLKFNVDGIELLVADRCLGWNMSWNYINEKGCVFGKTLNVGGLDYKCRLLLGGNGDPANQDNSEWKNLIVDLVQNDADSNWSSKFSFCQEEYYSKPGYAVLRGYGNIDRVSYENKSTTGTSTNGWRPVLELIENFSFSGIQDDYGNVSEFNPFNYSTTNLNGGNFNLTEKVDGQVIRTLNNQSNGEFTFNVENFDSLAYGKHTIEIIADDPTTDGNVTVTSKFNKIKSPVQPMPTNSNLKQVMLHDKELEKEISYQNFRLSEKLKEKGIEIVENESLSSLINKIDGVHQALNVISESTTDRIIMCSSFSGNDVLASDKIIEVFGSIRFYLYYSIDTQGYQARVLLEHIRDGKLVQSKLFTTYEWGAKVYYDIDNVNPGDRIRIFVPKVDRPTKITNASIRYEYSSK